MTGERDKVILHEPSELKSREDLGSFVNGCNSKYLDSKSLEIVSKSPGWVDCDVWGRAFFGRGGVCLSTGCPKNLRPVEETVEDPAQAKVALIVGPIRHG